MAIEIRELVIKASINKPLASRNEEIMDREALRNLKEEILQDCLEKVKELLDKKLSR